MDESPTTTTTTKPAIGHLIRHVQFGVGRVVGREGDCLVIRFRSGELRRVAANYAGLQPVGAASEVDLVRLQQALREVLADFGTFDAELELADRWQGGTLVLRPGKPGLQEKEVPIDVFLRKLVSIREKLRVLEQKINNHPHLTDADRLDLQAYITRSYGSLTTFNILFADKSGWFVGQSGGKED